ncbi:MAG: hypothetical protein HYV96_00475 [Opitutae bacterium]|nr:hypothetical protein [Opitutae bacterium]
MYTATVQLTINQFVPMNGTIAESPSIDATIAAPINTSPQPQTPVFSGDGEQIVITVPAGYDGSVCLTYQLPSSDYVLIGFSFVNPNGGAGRLQFPGVEVERDPTGGQATVICSCDPDYYNIDYSYVILVQEVATGNIGLIDPEIEIEINE